MNTHAYLRLILYTNPPVYNIVFGILLTEAKKVQDKPSDEDLDYIKETLKKSLRGKTMYFIVTK